MTSREFCYWLQGYFELCSASSLNDHQADLIRRHLAMVFQHEIDPSYPNGEVLSALHEKKAVPDTPAKPASPPFSPAIRC